MIIQLPGSLNVIVNFAAWLIIHVTVSLSIDRIQPNYFNPQKWLYRKRGWEKDGKIYQNLFIIRKWKGYLPDGARVSRNRFRKKLRGNPDPTYLRRFIQETCRAELIHWVIFAFSDQDKVPAIKEALGELLVQCACDPDLKQQIRKRIHANWVDNSAGGPKLNMRVYKLFAEILSLHTEQQQERELEPSIAILSFIQAELPFEAL